MTLGTSKPLTLSSTLCARCTPVRPTPIRHTERSGKRRPRMTRAVAVVFTLSAQKKTVESAELAHRIKTIEPAGKHLVDVALMTDVHSESVVRRVKNPVQGNCQFNNTEIWAQMPSGLG